jgi:hypothetical protein
LCVNRTPRGSRGRAVSTMGATGSAINGHPV